jgi:hypothetical protein
MKNAAKFSLMAAVVLSTMTIMSADADAGLFCRQPVRTMLKNTVCRVKTCRPVRSMACNTACRVRTVKPVRRVLRGSVNVVRSVLPPYGCCNSCSTATVTETETQKAPAPAPPAN